MLIIKMLVKEENIFYCLVCDPGRVGTLEVYDTVAILVDPDDLINPIKYVLEQGLQFSAVDEYLDALKVYQINDLTKKAYKVKVNVDVANFVCMYKKNKESLKKAIKLELTTEKGDKFAFSDDMDIKIMSDKFILYLFGADNDKCAKKFAKIMDIDGIYDYDNSYCDSLDKLKQFDMVRNNKYLRKLHLVE